jgi:cytochrome c5
MRIRTLNRKNIYEFLLNNRNTTLKTIKNNKMKKLMTISLLSLIVFACSKKTASTVAKTEVSVKTESATVSNAQYLAGKVVYEAKCGKCHKLHSPDRGNMEQWTKWIGRMAPKAKLTEEEKQLVTDYVSVNALAN